MRFADVILPLSIANAYTYELPNEFGSNVSVGCRVIVPLGKNKQYTGIIYKIHFDKPEAYETKPISAILDDHPMITMTQLKFWEWIAEYYQCKLGEVYKAALPSGLKLESETKVEIIEDYEATEVLQPKLQKVLDTICAQKKPIEISELDKLCGQGSTINAVKKLVELGAISIGEYIKEKYKPKVETYVRIPQELSNEESLHKIFDTLSKAEKQLNVMMVYLQNSHLLNSSQKTEISKSNLIQLSGCDANIISQLIKKGFLETYTKEVSRLSAESIYEQAKELSEPQKKAYREIMVGFRAKQTILLNGVTSSGKTEIYIHLIEEVIKLGKQALFLLPEIALTTQITNRLRKVFGDKLGVYHSKFSDAERIEIWDNLINDKGMQVILGVRSSIFLPFKNLGLIIVDEEHETTYKQYDPAPRYNARNAAIMLASISNAKVLLGSATPSLESYYNATSGKYSLVELKTRYENIEMPEIIIADTKLAKHRKEIIGHFTFTLRDYIKKALDKKEQIILFQNRRGFSPYVECKDCAMIPKCKNCDVSLTYHKMTNILTCHYCGYSIPLPNVCPACGNPSLQPVGFGTEQIEDEVKTLFPQAKVARLDLDTARSRKSYEKIIYDFERGDIDILVGTQIISKGLDFERVRVVGILNADTMINFPDFRAHERAFQLMAQVSGRAGRKNGQGIVVIQTNAPEHNIIQQVKTNDYKAMFNQQMTERKEFKYPPFFRMTNIYIKGRKFETVQQAATYFAECLRSVLRDRVFGPDKPTIMKIQNQYILKIMLKVEYNVSHLRIRDFINEVSNHVLAKQEFKNIAIHIDVDPM